jgi:hypothetical protein
MMQPLIDFFSENQWVRGLANVFGLLAGAVLTWKAVEFFVRLAKDALAENIRTALRRAKIRKARVYIFAACDIHYFVARSIARLGLFVLATAGLSMFAISRMYNSDVFIVERFKEQHLISNFETYKNIHESIDAASSVALGTMLILSQFMLLNLLTGVSRLRRRWLRRRRVKLWSTEASLK